jgi:23S rRNA-/tRNA-specific pseudouridylate synthase
MTPPSSNRPYLSVTTLGFIFVLCGNVPSANGFWSGSVPASQRSSVLNINFQTATCGVDTKTFGNFLPRSIHLKQSKSGQKVLHSSSKDENVVIVASQTLEEEKDGKNHRATKNDGRWRTVLQGVTRRTMALNEAVANLCKDNNIPITVEDAIQLIDIGAVWAKMETVTQEEILAQYGNDEDDEDSTALAQLQYGDMPRGWGSGQEDGSQDGSVDLDGYIEAMESLRFKRILSSCIIEQGTDLRVYPYPRRFSTACHDITHENGSLLYEDTTFIIVDKPPMLPTQPDSSNYQECLPGCVQSNLGPFQTIRGSPVVRPLLCHRVDSVVGGCVVLSKDGNGQKVFSRLQRERKVKKLYLAVTTKPVPVGLHVHWMWAPNNLRGVDNGPPCQLVSHATPSSRRVAKNFWIRCVLEVTKCEPIDIRKEDGHGYDPPENTKHYQNTIRLVTGRKHQVRAQLASLGAPIIRDTLYEAIAGLTLDNLDDDGEDDSVLDRAITQCRIPQEPIGLQAYAILFGGVKARARTPWWGNRKIADFNAM